jgi:hypothetical protein
VIPYIQVEFILGKKENFRKFILAKNDAYGFVTLMLTITFLIIAYVLLLNNLIALFKYVI